jgi:hypothetical protein
MLTVFFPTDDLILVVPILSAQTEDITLQTITLRFVFCRLELLELCGRLGRRGIRLRRPKTLGRRQALHV